MRIVVALCAVLAGLGCVQAFGAPLRSSAGLHLFDEFAPRPPRAIPNVRRNYSASAPLPRAKPPAQPTPAAAPPAGPIEFPPVAPLE